MLNGVIVTLVLVVACASPALPAEVAVVRDGSAVVWQGDVVIRDGQVRIPRRILFEPGASYSLWVKPANALSAIVPIEGEGRDRFAYLGGPQWGDLDGDNRVYVEDTNILLRSWYASAGDASYNPAADFDANGIIDYADLDAMTINFFQYGTGMLGVVE